MSALGFERNNSVLDIQTQVIIFLTGLYLFILVRLKFSGCFYNSGWLPGQKDLRNVDKAAFNLLGFELTSVQQS